MKKLIAAIILPLLICACSQFSSALTDKDVEQYVQAYRNIAAISPALELKQKETKSLTVLTCTPCRAELTKAVQQAGYKDLTAFHLADVRMHLAIRAHGYAEIARVGGELSGQAGVEIETFCRSKDDIARSKNPKETTRECQQVLAMSDYLGRAGKVVVELAQKLLHEGDIAMIGKYHDAIIGALFNDKLVSDFRHVRGGADFD